MAATYEPPTRFSGMGAQETAAPETSESLIDPHSHFNGHYRTARDLRVEGTAQGEIECEGTVTVAPNAKLEAKVQARNVILAGSANGEIVCRDRFTLKPTGEMRGQVRAASLVVEEGAFFEGDFQMAETPAQPAAQPTLQRDAKPDAKADKRENKPTLVLPDAPPPTPEVVTAPVEAAPPPAADGGAKLADGSARPAGEKSRPEGDARPKSSTTPSARP